MCELLNVNGPFQANWGRRGSKLRSLIDHCMQASVLAFSTAISYDRKVFFPQNRSLVTSQECLTEWEGSVQLTSLY